MASTGHTRAHCSQAMQTDGSMKYCSSSGAVWMQSTGQTSRQAAFLTPTHGWVMTYVENCDTGFYSSVQFRALSGDHAHSPGRLSNCELPVPAGCYTMPVLGNDGRMPYDWGASGARGNSVRMASAT